MKKKTVLLINGPNLNLLGKRETKIYGKTTLKKLVKKLKKKANVFKINLKTFQSNSESKLIEKIQISKNLVKYIIINASAYTHTSIALRDALLSVKIPFIEVHISNIYSRENFRANSWLSDISSGIICGLGTKGYFLALDAINEKIIKNKNNC
ncbi:type II 3-dehydroquinate dehydratase [Buchnera aphidicola (Ceratovacuna keduensis)]|uniref:type II 3-dehydroquinate dehydratase n=1 Tax=Buchnera aphidicola TaxID=9 RepID=UPI0031B83014